MSAAVSQSLTAALGSASSGRFPYFRRRSPTSGSATISTIIAAADHPLASWSGKIPREELSKHIQLVLTDRSDLSERREFGAWTSKLADLFAKQAFLIAGLG